MTRVLPVSPVADDRIARIERGIHLMPKGSDEVDRLWAFVLAGLRAWQEIAERHVKATEYCTHCVEDWPCPDRQAADAALDRLDALWAGESRG